MTTLFFPLHRWWDNDIAVGVAPPGDVVALRVQGDVEANAGEVVIGNHAQAPILSQRLKIVLLYIVGRYMYSTKVR